MPTKLGDEVERDEESCCIPRSYDYTVGTKSRRVFKQSSG
jgi:hypothetical protein